MDESSVQQDLSRWLSRRTNGEVYWAESPPDSYGKFQFSGTSKRPDLLALAEHNTVIEVKDASSSNNVYDAMSQAHKYWRRYENGNAAVEVDGEEVNVDLFLIATQFSPRGYLFKREREGGHRKVYENDEHWNYGERPQFACARTEAISRIMWRYAWAEYEDRGDEYEEDHEYHEKDRSDISSGIGVLLSSASDNDFSDDEIQSGLDSFGSDAPPGTTPKALYYIGDIEEEDNQDSVWTDL